MTGKKTLGDAALLASEYPHVRPRVGIALGSGSARGLAHIGVLRGLHEIGIEPEVVTGTSIGALVGAAYVSGHLEELATWFLGLSTRDMIRYLDISLIARGGVGNTNRLIEQLRRSYGDPDIESLPRAFAAVATDLASGRELWLQNGPIWEAVSASIALPGIFRPIEKDNRWLVDGALVNPVPVSVCRALGAEVIIAVELNSELLGRRLKRWSSQQSVPAVVDQNQDELVGSLFARLSRNLREKKSSRHGQQPEAYAVSIAPEQKALSVLGVVANSINIMQDRITRSRLAGEPADVVLALRLGNVGILDFDKAGPAIEEGANCVHRMAPVLRHALSMQT